MGWRLNLVAGWLLGASVFLVAATAGVYFALALPANDDWMRSAQPLNMGWWTYCHHLYLTWQGRWVSFGLESAVLPLGDLTKTYPLLIGGVAVINLIGVFGICRFFTRSASVWFSLGVSCVLAAVLWAQMPSVAQNVYWFTGVVENAMPIALSALLLIALVCLGDNLFWAVFAAGWAIVICGIHESYGSMLCIALAAGTVAAYRMGSGNKRTWLIVLIAAVIGLAIVVGAPGNRVRLKSDGPKHARLLLDILKLTDLQLWDSVRAWLFDPKLLGVTLWVIFSPRLEAARPVFSGAKKVPWTLLFVFAWVCMMGVGFFAPSYAFDEDMPARTLSGNFLVFALGWLVIVFVWSRDLSARDALVESPGGGSGRSLRNASSAAIALLLISAGLLVWGNTPDGIHDLANRHVFKWRASVEHRFALLREPGPDDRILPRLLPVCHLLYDSEIGTDTTDWHNWPLANRFGLKKIRVLPLGLDQPLNRAEGPAVKAESMSQKAQ